MSSCAKCVVRENSICHALSADARDELSRTGRRQIFRPGQTLMREGEPSLLVGNVVEGIVKLSASLADGCEQTLGIAYPGDFIGRAFGAPSQHSVTALTNSEVCTFRRSEFDTLGRQHADLEHELLGLTIETVSRQFTNLRNRQIIATPDQRSIVIRNRGALVACSAGKNERMREILAA